MISWVSLSALWSRPSLFQRSHFHLVKMVGTVHLDHTLMVVRCDHTFLAMKLVAVLPVLFDTSRFSYFIELDLSYHFWWATSLILKIQSPSLPNVVGDTWPSITRFIDSHITNVSLYLGAWWPESSIRLAQILWSLMLSPKMSLAPLSAQLSVSFLADAFYSSLFGSAWYF